MIGPNLQRTQLFAYLALFALTLIRHEITGMYICRCNALCTRYQTQRSRLLSSKDMLDSRSLSLDSSALSQKTGVYGSKTLSMGLEVRIRIVGRKNGGEPWLESSYSTYETRLKSTNLKVTTQWHKNDDDLIKGTDGDAAKSHTIVLLDPCGKMCTSEKLSNDMYRWLEEGGSRLTFVIGGAEGLPNELKINYGSKMLSLSSLTFTHQLARILLMEQIYRASEIKKGSGYHK